MINNKKTKTIKYIGCFLMLVSTPLIASPKSYFNSYKNKEVKEGESSSAETKQLLTPKRKLFIEPSLTYVNSSSTQVAIEGFTVVPAIVIGLINVSQVNRDTLTAAINFRYDITNRLELGLKVPYVYREETVRQRDAFKGTPVDSIDNSSGEGLGDVEVSVNYQFEPSKGSSGYWISSLQIKSRTGTDVFEIESRFLSEESGDDGQGQNESQEEVTGLVLQEQPTGSGFWSMQPGLTYVHQSDPAVLYGSLSYLWNKEREVGEEFGGTIDPGDSIGLGFGMGLALNDNVSFTLGYSHNVVKKTRIKNEIVGIQPTFSRIQVGSLKFGLARRLTKDTSAKFSLGVGVTDAAPDLQIGISLPSAFY